MKKDNKFKMESFNFHFAQMCGAALTLVSSDIGHRYNHHKDPSFLPQTHIC